MAIAHAPQVLAQVRALGVPAADAHVGVVALGEQPAVAARHVAHLEQRDVPLDARADRVVGDVGLERRGEDAAFAELQRAPAGAVGAIGRDQQLRARARAVVERDRRPAVGLELDGARAHPVAEGGAGEHRLLGQEGIQAEALRHQDDGRKTAVLEGSEARMPERDRGDLPFHHRPDRERQQAGAAQRDAAAAGLVARKARAVDQQRPHALAGEQMRRDRARRARRRPR